MELKRKQWLQWTVLNYEQLSRLHQPPYGERAIIQKNSNKLIAVCGFVPCLDCFEQLCDFNQLEISNPQSLTTTEFGLFYAISKSFQGFGFATEAAYAMVTYAFEQLHVKRIIATTTYDNQASISVMNKLGMHLKRNPHSLPSWLQIVGFLNNPSTATEITNQSHEKMIEVIIKLHFKELPKFIRRITIGIFAFLDVKEG